MSKGCIEMPSSAEQDRQNNRHVSIIDAGDANLHDTTILQDAAVSVMDENEGEGQLDAQSLVINDKALPVDNRTMVDSADGADAVVNAQLPAITDSLSDVASSSNLAQYLQTISQYPMLSITEERELAVALRQQHDLQAAHKLVTSHLRLVAKIAFGYRGYGLPIADLVSEGNVGLLQAVKNYDPDKGARLATYAMWWIKAAIHEYVLRSWSLVKIGTSSAQKKLFFNLRRLKHTIKQHDETLLDEQQATQIANQLDVNLRDVKQMEMRLMGGDKSLNAMVSQHNEGDTEWISMLPDERGNQEDMLMEVNQQDYRQKIIQQALEQLSIREREIFVARKLQENVPTLEELGKLYGISRERIRQIETQAMKKFKQAVLAKQDSESDLLSFA